MKRTYTFLKNEPSLGSVNPNDRELVLAALVKDEFTETTILAIAINLSVQTIVPILLQLKAQKKVSDRYQFKGTILWREWKLEY